ncbi:hypothetical protein FKW78_24315 [Mycolicibacterium fortuitum]|nr:hypothetical protein FKW78_24315 [Mycolicibacterium fortuitum]
MGCTDGGAPKISCDALWGWAAGGSPAHGSKPDEGPPGPGAGRPPGPGAGPGGPGRAGGPKSLKSNGLGVLKRHQSFRLQFSVEPGRRSMGYAPMKAKPDPRTTPGDAIEAGGAATSWFAEAIAGRGLPNGLLPNGSAGLPPCQPYVIYVPHPIVRRPVEKRTPTDSDPRIRW